MARVRPFEEFVKAVVGEKTREEFLQWITEPHLYFLDLPRLAMTPSFRTFEFRTGVSQTPNPSDTPTASQLQERDWTRELGERGIVPLRKDSETNAFSMMLTVGRAPNNDIVIPDKRVSKFHAYFRREGDVWTLTDANSTNGTWIDGMKLTPEQSVVVGSGAMIDLGSVLRVTYLEPAELYTLLQEFHAIC